MISVIVPVYKVEAYLDQCVASIVNQTYRDLEIILVDDGSPDRCPELCDAWAQRDSRIRVIHKKNGGLSDARNAGMEAATGEFIGFVDSDDWLSKDFYEVLYETAQRHGASIAASGIVKTTQNKEEFFGTRFEQVVFSPEEAIHTIMHGEGFHAVAWNKLYARKIFEGIRYPVGKLHEDEYVTYRLLDRAERLVLCLDAVYYYRQRTGSIMASWSVRHLDGLEAGLGRLKLLRQRYPGLYPEDAGGFCVACVMNYRKLLDMKAEQKEFARLRDFRNQVKLTYGQWITMKPIHKLYVLASWKTMGLFARLLNLRRKIDG